VANSILPKFSNTVLDKLREDRYQPRKNYSRDSETSRESMTTYFSRKIGVELILSFHDGNETSFSDDGLTILHAPNGTGPPC
jgi:hypothetical protein